MEKSKPSFGEQKDSVKLKVGGGDDSLDHEDEMEKGFDNDENDQARASRFNTKQNMSNYISKKYSFTNEDIRLEHNRFKLEFFGKFLLLNLIRIIFGPFTYLFIFRNPKWRTIARNFSIFGGQHEIFRLMLWAIRIYCIVITCMHSPNHRNANLYVNLYILAFTEFSLGVLYAAYFASYRKSEIDEFMTDSKHKPTSNDISTCLYDLKKQNLDDLFESNRMTLDHPEIDRSMFYFVVPEVSKYAIPKELQLIPEKYNAEFFDDLQDVVLIDGSSMCKAILKHSQFNSKFVDSSFKIGKIISRLIVFLRVLYPIIIEIIDLIEADTHTIDNWLVLSAYVFYAILLWRFYMIYDTLFLGLILYIEKLSLMLYLSNMIADKQVGSAKPPLKISLFIPQNIANWINARRLLSSANQQVYNVVDVNLSYTMIYLAIYVAFLLGQSFGIGMPSFMKNPGFQVVTATYLLVMIIILFIGLIIGVLINTFFHTHQKILVQKLDILKNLRDYMHFYLDHLSNIEEKVMQNPYDRYFRELIELKEILKNDRFLERYNSIMETNIRVIRHAIKELLWDEYEHPHRILGLRTTAGTVATIGSFLSILGISNVKLIANSLAGSAK